MLLEAQAASTIAIRQASAEGKHQRAPHLVIGLGDGGERNRQPDGAAGDRLRNVEEVDPWRAAAAGVHSNLPGQRGLELRTAQHGSPSHRKSRAAVGQHAAPGCRSPWRVRRRLRRRIAWLASGRHWRAERRQLAGQTSPSSAAGCFQSAAAESSPQAWVMAMSSVRMAAAMTRVKTRTSLKKIRFFTSWPQTCIPLRARCADTAAPRHLFRSFHGCAAHRRPPSAGVT